MENRPITVTEGQNTTTFVYDGDGNRVMKTEGGEIVLYINKYYEKNLMTEEETTYYYLGDRLVAMKKGDDLRYIQQDHLSGTALTTDEAGAQVGTTMKYLPFGECRNSPPYPTDILFTGQRLDDTGLYYCNARYYDPTIGRFVSPDTFVQYATGFNSISFPLTVNTIPLGLGSIGSPQGIYPQSFPLASMNPQALNRYSYVSNNPLRYTDPTGYLTWRQVAFASIMAAFDFGVAIPITLVAIASYLTPPVAPAMTALAAAVDIFATGLTIYCLYQIAQDSPGNSDSMTPQLPASRVEPVETTPPVPSSPTNACRILTNPYEAPDPVHTNNVDTGFTAWGTNDSGGEVISIRDPSNYASWEWY